MSSKNIRKMVTTAILIALTVVFQLMRPMLGGAGNPVSTYIIGSLVNLCLIIAACIIGLWSGLAVAIITPIIAMWQGQAVLIMVPWIMAGNAALVVCFALFGKHAEGKASNDWVRFMIVGVVAALIKYAIITLGTTFMMSSTQGKQFSVAIGLAASKQIQQVVTAIIGTFIAKLVILALPANIKEF